MSLSNFSLDFFVSVLIGVIHGCLAALSLKHFKFLENHEKGINLKITIILSEKIPFNCYRRNSARESNFLEICNLNH